MPSNLEKSMSVKQAEERIALLKADPSFKKLRSLVLQKLKGKTLGQEIQTVTTDSKYAKQMKNKNVVVLTEEEFSEFEQLDRACDNLAEKYGLPRHTVFDLALGGKPVRRLAKTIRAGLDPLVFKPKDFSPGKHYIGFIFRALPPEVAEIMRRLPQDLDEQTRAEIRSYLDMLAKDKPACRILELKDKPARRILELEETNNHDTNAKPPCEIDIWLKVPLGYSAKDVAEVYKKMDRDRRQVLLALGCSVNRRRRVSKVLFEAEELRLFKDKLERSEAYEILDDIEDRIGKGSRSDSFMRKKIGKKRYKGRILLKKKLKSDESG